MAQLRFFRALEWLSKTTPTTLKADVLAGLTNAAIVLHQGVAFATIAGLPPEYGLYTAMITAIIAALLFADLTGMAVPGTTRCIELVLLLTLLVGLFQIIAGLARLGEQGRRYAECYTSGSAEFPSPITRLVNVAILTSSAAAVALVGLLEAISIGRTFTLRRHEPFAPNQVIVAQSLSNSVGSFFQFYAGSGSFTRSGVNAEAGAVSPLSAISARVRTH